MNQEWIVVVKDDKKTAITSADVCLIQGALPEAELPYPSIGVTHAHKADGRYEASATITGADGDWLLVVRAAGKSPVVQTLKLKAATGGLFTTTASPRTAAAIALKTETITVAGTSVRRTTFTVTMYAASEYVFISGLEYFDAGTQFHLFAEKRREVLRREKKLDAGSLITIFSCDHRWRETTVLANEAKWLLVCKKVFGPAAEVKPGKAHTAVVGKDISAVDLYKYVDAVGKRAPGSVREVGWFCHSYAGGPVLFNTSDERDDDQRDADDWDGRAKDFNDTQWAIWPDVKTALTTDAAWRVWGCSATTHIKDMMRAALKQKAAGTKPDKAFTVNTEVHYHGHDAAKVARYEDENITLDSLRNSVNDSLRGDGYCSSAATRLGVHCYGSPPGVGSNFVNVGGITLMMIIKTDYSQVYNYCAEEFKPEFKATNGTYDKGYVDYNALKPHKAITKPAFKPDLYLFIRNLRDTYWLLKWYNDQQVWERRTNVKLSVFEKKAFGHGKEDGVLYVVVDKDDDTLTKAWFVTTDGRVFRGVRDATTKKFEDTGTQI